MPDDMKLLDEAMTQIVYGDTFALYDHGEIDDFIEPLTIRYVKNKLDLDHVFAGKRCLDAGCGGGRGSIFMARHGAAEVHGVDFTPRNIATVKKACELFGVTNFHPHLSTLETIPFPDNSFDAVWCNGVLHHMVEPDAGLREVCRVLKPGGKLWLYLYGSGGIYWGLVDIIREHVRDIRVHDCVAMLLAFNVPTGRIAEYIDDWYVPWIRRYRHEDVAASLASLGVEEAEWLHYGTHYDTSNRVSVFDEREIFGMGDLRYLATKTSGPKANYVPLPGLRGLGSDWDESDTTRNILAPIAALFERIAVADKPTQAVRQSCIIGFAMTLQFDLRNLMSQDRPFDLKAFNAIVSKAARRFTAILDA